MCYLERPQRSLRKKKEYSSVADKSKPKANVGDYSKHYGTMCSFLLRRSQCCIPPPPLPLEPHPWPLRFLAQLPPYMDKNNDKDRVMAQQDVYDGERGDIFASETGILMQG